MTLRAGIPALAIVCAALAWSGCVVAAPHSQATARIDTITILHTNDVHAHLLADEKGRGGWAAIAALIKREKGRRPDVLALDAGDMTQGTPVSSIFHGVPIFHVMNECGYDVAVLGNHEFDNGTRYIREFREIASFPLLSANVLEDGQLVSDAPTALIDVDGVRVGIIGITTSESIFQEGVSFLSPEDVVQKYVPELDREAHLIVALTHLGVERDKELAAATKGIDVIVGGHSNTRLATPIKVGDTWIVQAGNWGLHLGQLELSIDLDTEDLLAVHGELIPIPQAGLAPDADASAVIEAWESKVAARMNVKIGHNPVEQDIPTLRAHIEQIWLETYATDFAHQNPGGTRAYLPGGDILVRHIWSAMPFDNTLVIVDLSRDQVRRIIPDARFAERKELYSVITNSYIGDRMQSDFDLPLERIHPIQTVWRDPILDYVRKHGHLNPE